MKNDDKNTIKKNAHATLLGDSSNDQLVSMPAFFAKELLKQIIYNPKSSTVRNSYSFSIYTKENIIKWLQSPVTNEKNLRNASIYLYLSSQQYQRLIEYYAGLLTWAFVISPLNFDSTKLKNSDSFRKQYLRVAHLLETMNIPQIMRDIIIVALREGAFYGVRWMDSNSSFIQKLNADYCQITSISDGIFLFSFDMSQVQTEKLQFYPPCFTDMYNTYKATGTKYQEVPADLSVCLKADSSLVDYTVPTFGAVMPSLYTIANVESLQETADELKNYKMITGKVPVDEEGNPKMDWDLVQKYYKHLALAVGENVGVAVTPFDLNSFNFEQKSGVSDTDTIARATSNFWMTAGSSGLLHGLMNDTAGVTKLAIKNDESYVFGMMKQAERLINRYLKTSVTGTTKFKITFLPITIYNQEDYIKMYKEAVAFGIGKSYYLAALGISQYDVDGLSYLENNVLELDSKLIPLKNSHSTSSEDLGTGRPAVDDTDLSPEGESTRGNDTNANK